MSCLCRYTEQPDKYWEANMSQQTSRIHVFFFCWSTAIFWIAQPRAEGANVFIVLCLRFSVSALDFNIDTTHTFVLVSEVETRFTCSSWFLEFQLKQLILTYKQLLEILMWVLLGYASARLWYFSQAAASRGLSVFKLVARRSIYTIRTPEMVISGSRDSFVIAHETLRTRRNPSDSCKHVFKT